MPYAFSVNVPRSTKTQRKVNRWSLVVVRWSLAVSVKRYALCVWRLAFSVHSIFYFLIFNFYFNNTCAISCQLFTRLWPSSN